MESQNKIPQNLDDLRFQIRNSLNTQNKIKIGKFILLERLGGGAYGDVYKAMHQDNQKYFAVKIIDKQLLFIKNTNPYVREVLTRLLQTQGVLMQMCQSPYVLKCYEIIQNKRYKIFVLQYCNRQSLHDQLKKRKSYPINQALAILKQIITGLAQLHKNKIIHRDLKAENIMVHNGKYKIADFGFSKKIDSEDRIGNFTVLGTRMTMAPEVSNQAKYGIKADIWSIGVIFFTMICSNIPYQAQGGTARPKNITGQVKKGGNIFFSTLDGMPDQQLVKFLKSMLTINPQKRISWRDLVKHKIFARCQQDIFHNPLDNVNILQADQTTQIDQVQLTKHQQQVMKRAKSKDAQQQIRKQLNQTIKIQIQQVTNIKTFQKITKQDVDQKLYREIQKNNLQCHKSIYIFQKIAMELQNKKMIDLSRKSHVQFLYLLLTRCFFNVSWANANLQLNANNQTFVSYHDQIQQIYKKILNKWQDVGKMLTKSEGKLTSIIAGFKDSIIARDKKQKYELFFTGIQKINYTKQSQVQYTQNQYIQTIIQQLKGSNKQVQIMKQKLQAYKKINQITLQQLQKKGISFLQRVKELVIQP